MSSLLNLTDAAKEADCSYTFDTSNAKFWLVGIIGTNISLLGILANALLLFVLLKKTLRNSYLAYLAFLALLDIGILATYLALFSVKIFKEDYRLLFFHVAWINYSIPLFFVSKVSLLAQTYLIVAVSVERFFEVISMRRHVGLSTMVITNTHRFCVAFVVIAFAVLFRLPVIWESVFQLLPEVRQIQLTIVHNETCVGQFAEYELDQTKLAVAPWYKFYYRMWADMLVRVVVPFFLLLVVNLFTIWGWHKTLRRFTTTEALIRWSLLSAEQLVADHKNFLNYSERETATISLNSPSSNVEKPSSSTFSEHEKDQIGDREVRRQGLKTATSMMIALVSSYLVCNLLNLLITIWERVVDLDNVEKRVLVIYSLASDVTSLLVITNSSLRLPIYYACNVKIRMELRQLIQQLLGISLLRKLRRNRKQKDMWSDESQRNNNNNNRPESTNLLSISSQPTTDDCGICTDNV